MSADNGVYILCSPRRPLKVGSGTIPQKGYEYRVAHTSAIDNLDNILWTVSVFGNSQVYLDWDDAFQEAKRIYSELVFTEYGICDVHICDYFPNMTAKAARKALDIYEGSEPLDY